MDKEHEEIGHRYVRYADNFTVYVKSKKAAKGVGNSIYKFLRDKLQLPIHREKSGIRRSMDLQVFGLGFVFLYRNVKREIPISGGESK
ncbi:hypothetical protein MWU76_10160 [Gelidibacter sp. F2691]|nr:hypothetical protein [Gelidibacter sp. F2691]